LEKKFPSGGDNGGVGILLDPTKRQLNFGFNSFQTLLICDENKDDKLQYEVM